MDVIDIIRAGLEQLTRSNPMEFPELNTEEVRHSLIHDLKNMVVDIQNLKKKSEILEDRTMILIQENAKLKLLYEDVCHELSKLQSDKKQTRKKS